MVIHTVKRLTQESLDEYRKLVKEHDKIIIRFTATWCGPCRAIAPIYESFSERYKDIHFVSVDVDESPDLSAEFGIRAMPSFTSIKSGEKEETLLGANPAGLQKLTEVLDSL